MDIKKTLKSILTTKTMVAWHMRGDIAHRDLYLPSSHSNLRRAIAPNLQKLRDLSRVGKWK